MFQFLKNLLARKPKEPGGGSHAVNSGNLAERNGGNIAGHGAGAKSRAAGDSSAGVIGGNPTPKSGGAKGRPTPQGADNKPVKPNGGALSGIFSKLSRKQKREFDAAILAAKGINTYKPMSVQDSIPYLAMYPDGVCHVTGKLYSRSLP